MWRRRLRTRWRLPLLNKRIYATVATVLLCAQAAVVAQERRAPPIPTWSGEGSVPARVKSHS